MVLKIGPQKLSPLSPLSPVEDEVSDLDREDCRCEGCGTPDADVLFVGIIIGEEELLLCGKCALPYLLWKEGG